LNNQTIEYEALKFREPLRGEIDKEDIPDYLAWWTDRMLITSDTKNSKIENLKRKIARQNARWNW
jgi:hypothetical protein